MRSCYHGIRSLGGALPWLVVPHRGSSRLAYKRMFFCMYIVSPFPPARRGGMSQEENVNTERFPRSCEPCVPAPGRCQVGAGEQQKS